MKGPVGLAAHEALWSPGWERLRARGAQSVKARVLDPASAPAAWGGRATCTVLSSLSGALLGRQPRGPGSDVRTQNLQDPRVAGNHGGQPRGDHDIVGSRSTFRVEPSYPCVRARVRA